MTGLDSVTMFTFRLPLSFLALTGGLAAQPAVPSLPVITEAKELHRLTRAEMLLPRQVSIKGVLTYKRGDEFNDFAIQDETGGFIADVPITGPRTQSLQSGQEIEVEGFTVIAPPPAPRVSITRLTAGKIVGLPEPIPLTPQALLGGAGLFSYVEFNGVIRSSRIETDLDPHRLVLDFGPPDQRLSVRLARFNDETIARLKPDTRVRVRGTALAWTSVNLQPYSIFIGVHDASQVDVMSEARPPSEATLVPLAELLSTHPEGFDERYERVRGTVTLNWPGEMVVIQGANGAIRTMPVGPTSLRPGDEVDASGFPSAASGRIFLDEAVFGTPIPGSLPEPEKIGVRRLMIEASAVDREARRLRVSGVLREIGRRDGHSVLNMESEGKAFDALLPEHEKLPENLRPGASLELTGICHYLVGENARRFAIRLDGFELHLADPSGIRLLSAPPWWTSQRLATAIAVILVILGLSLVWVGALRRRVAIRSAMLVKEIRARHDTQLLVSERSRLAADLHDTLSQTLSGAALQMEIAESLDDSPKAEGHRTLARRLVDRSREDLRRAVWDLTPSVLLHQDLRAAFESIATELSEDSNCSISVHASTPLPILPERTRSHLLRVGQEAIHNAIQHGHSTHIDVSLTPTPSHLALTVEDDGAGFDPVQIPGPTEGHFGLSSMRNRILRLGGTFDMKTSPRGTIITSTVPLTPLPHHP